LLALLAIGCGSKPTDPKTLIPADTIIYLETNDLGATLAAITENQRFQELAKTKPDLSVLKGVQVSVAVTGFEASQEEVAEEGAVLSFQSRFVAVAETNAWGWQAKSFVEDKLGELVNEVYGGEIGLEITTRNDGSEYYVWTSQDGRKAYALQQGSVVFFGNDESAIERCQAVKRGEVESIAKAGKVGEDGRLAFAYVSSEGVGQLANLVGLQLAKTTGEEADVQSFVARVLPEILRNSVKEVRWSAVRSEGGVEDRFEISLENEAARVFSETLSPARSESSELAKFVPASALSATRYLLKDPQIAWRGLVLTAQKKTDAASGALIAAFSGSIFESYGIEEPESFLSSIGSQIVTVRLTQDSDDVAVITTFKNLGGVRQGIAKEINFGGEPEKKFDADVWKSEDGELSAAFIGETVVVGNSETVLKCLEARQGNMMMDTRGFSTSDAVATTIGNEEASGRVVEAFSERRDDKSVMMTYQIETRFNINGIERRTRSDFGLIGAIIERLMPD
jgi:hypothetical protein